MSDLVRRLRAARVVSIETARSSSSVPRVTPIWIVVDERDRILVRSVRGTRGRWYRDLVANPVAAIRAGGDRIGVRAEPAADAERVDACSRALASKYPRAGASLASMLVPDTLGTTMELVPV